MTNHEPPFLPPWGDGNRSAPPQLGLDDPTAYVSVGQQPSTHPLRSFEWLAVVTVGLVRREYHMFEPAFAFPSPTGRREHDSYDIGLCSRCGALVPLTFVPVELHALHHARTGDLEQERLRVRA